MKTIGITGGVGTGKTELLAYIGAHYNCRIILADEAAHQAERPGEKGYGELVELLGEEILDTDGSIHKYRMAEKIFRDKNVLEQVNRIIHPKVKEYILQEIEENRKEGKVDFLFVEAALLIEDGYEEILDELWYIHTRADIRRERLRSSRAYSDEKIERIMQGQLPEEEFRKHCKVVIENNESLAQAYKQIDKKLEEYLCRR